MHSFTCFFCLQVLTVVVWSSKLGNLNDVYGNLHSALLLLKQFKICVLDGLFWLAQIDCHVQLNVQ